MASLTRRALAFTASLALALSLLPLSALADVEQGQEPVEEETLEQPVDERADDGQAEPAAGELLEGDASPDEPADEAAPAEDELPEESAGDAQEALAEDAPLGVAAPDEADPLGVNRSASNYSTLVWVLNNCVDGDVITLGGSITATDTLKVTKNITIDMNGYTLSMSANKPLINVTGSLTLIGNGTIYNDGFSDYRYATIVQSGSGSITIDGPTVRSSKDAIRFEGSGTLTMKSGMVTSESGSALDIRHPSTTNGPTIDIQGGTLIAPRGHGVDLMSAASTTLTMSGGTIQASVGISTEYIHTKVTISGGTIEATNTVLSSYNSTYDYPHVITGGTFRGRSILYVGDAGNTNPYVRIMGGDFEGVIDIDEDVTLNNFVYGGSFDTTLPTSYLAPGYTQGPDGEIVDVIGNNVVRLNHGLTRVKYTTIAAALSRAQDGDTLVMLADVEQETPLQVTGIGITLDLAGHTIAYAGDEASLITVAGGGSLTVTDSSADGTGAIDSSASTYEGAQAAAIKVDSSELVVSGGSVAGKGLGVNAVAGSSVSVTGGSVTGSTGIRAYGDGVSVSVADDAAVTGTGATGSGISVEYGDDITIAVAGGTVTGFQGINQAQGTMELTVTDGQVVGTHAAAQDNVAAIAAKGTSTVSITGGTVTGKNALWLQPSFSSGTCTPTISGGDFFGAVTSSAEGFVTGGTFDALADAYVAPGYYKATIEDDRVSVERDTIALVLPATSTVYTGADQTPAVSLRYLSGGATFPADEVEWILGGAAVDKVDVAGVYTVVASYGSDSVSGTFTVEPRNINFFLPPQTDPMWEDHYDGAGDHPALSLTYQGMDLVEGTDYTLAFVAIPGHSILDVPYVQVVNIAGQGNYTGTASRTVTWYPLEVPSDRVRVEEIPPQNWQYRPVTPSVVVQVSVDGQTWKTIPSNCYKVEYTDNEAPGTAHAAITLGYLYSGTAEADFVILDRTRLSSLISDSYSFAYGQELHYPDISYAPDGTIYLPADVASELKEATAQAVEQLSATTQDELDAAESRLRETYTAARDRLVTHHVDRSELTRVVSQASDDLNSTVVSEDGETVAATGEALQDMQQYVSQEDWDAFEDAYLYALEVSQSEGVSQYQVDAACAVLADEGAVFDRAKQTYWAYTIDISTARVTIANKPYDGVSPYRVLGGDIVDPVITVRLGDGTRLTYGTEFVVVGDQDQDRWEVSACELPGTHTVTVEGRGRYVGTASTTYTIYEPFTDVTKRTAHYEDIMWMSATGISRGWGEYPRCEYRPMSDIARCDMAAFLYRLAGEPAFEPTPEELSHFTDVNVDTPHYKEVLWMYRERITTGYRNSDGTFSFKPYGNVYRCDMAAFLYRLAGYPPLRWSSFTDVDESTSHWKEILWLAYTGVSTGYPDGTFRPMDTVKRQDMAAFLHRMYDYDLLP